MKTEFASAKYRKDAKHRARTCAVQRSTRRVRIERLEKRLLLAFDPVGPVGSLIYEQAPIAEEISVAAEVDQFNVDLDAGQVLSLLVAPDSALQPEVELLDPLGGSVGSDASSSPGVDALLQTAPINTAGTYTVEVRGGETTGGYTLAMFLNAALEEEPNDAAADAQDLSASFIQLGNDGAARGAVLGTADAGGDDWYSFTLEDGESASLAATVTDPSESGVIALELYDDAGSTLLATGIGAENVQQLIAGFVDDTNDGSTDSYLARITGDALDYSLVVTRNTAFDVEANNDFDTAFSISGQSGALGHALDSGSGTATQFDTPILNFDGQGFNSVQPPDTVGDVGRDYYIQMINSPGGADFTIYSKSDGSVALAPITLDSLAPPGSPGEDGLGDPIVLYDHLAERWMLTEFTDFAVGNFLNIYISQTSDPTDNVWHYYSVQTPEFPDYPKFAVREDAYYVSYNTGFGDQAPVLALDRTNMLQGLAARPAQRFSAPPLPGFGFQAFTPADLDGPASPAGSPGYFMRHRDDEVHSPGSNDVNQDFLEIWELDVDFDSPANSTFTQIADIPITDYENELNGFFGGVIPQPGSSVLLDALQNVIMHRLQYRNFGTHETLVGNFTVDTDGADHAGIRWFELRKTGGGSWQLHQEGTIDPDADHRWMGAISMDGDGNIALGYNVSSSSVSPSIRYIGRLADDPPGTMPRGEHTLFNGQGANNLNRWGDYSAMSVDPVDDSTFWFTGEYALNGAWGTRIGAMDLENPADNDWYQFAVNEDDVVTVSTFTPAAGAGAFVNELDPGIQIFDPNEIEVPHTTVPGNESFEFTATNTGDYRLRVFSESATQGEYFARIAGASGSGPAPFVAATSPTDGLRLTGFPLTYTVTFTEALRVPSLQAEDLRVNGFAALDVVPVDGRTFEFTINPAADIGDGTYNVSIAADAVEDLQGELNAAFNGTFVVDTAGPVITSTLWNGSPLSVDATVPTGTFSFEATFDEPLQAFRRAGRGLRTPGTDDITLMNNTTGQDFSPTAVGFDEGTNSWSADFAPLPEGSYTLTLLSRDGGFEDEVGNDLDGEFEASNPPDGTPTGDGNAGGDYVVNFSVDRGTASANEFKRLSPFGGLISASGGNTGLLGSAQDTDAFEFFLEAEQLLSAVAQPSDASVTLSLEIPGLAGPVFAPAPGAPVALPPTFIGAEGSHAVRVGGDGATTFTLDVYRNAAPEQQVIDSEDGNELLINDSFLPLGSGRYGVVGHSGEAVDPNLLSEDFNSGIPLTWTTTNINNVVPWGDTTQFNNLGNLTGGSGLAAFADSDFTNEDALPYDSRLISPLVNLSGVSSATLNYRAYFRDLPEIDDNDKLDVDVSSDGGASWQTVQSYQTNSEIGEGESFDESIDISNFTGSSQVQVRFRYYNLAGEWDWYAQVDDVSITVAQTPASDVDEYLLDLTGKANRRIDVVLAGQDDVDFSGETLELLDTDGTNVLATAGPQGDNYDLGMLDFTVPADGVYTLRLSSNTTGSYALVVTEDLTFDTEPNDDASSDPLRSLDDTRAALGAFGAGVASGFLQLYSDRSTFDTDHPGLPVEDFEEGNVGAFGLTTCAGPLSSSTNNNCFDAGDILPGIGIEDDAPGNAVDEMAVVGDGLFGNATKVVGPNSDVQNTEISFPDADVFAIGLDVQTIFGGTVGVTVFDLNNDVLAETVVGGTNAFFGVAAGPPIGRIMLTTSDFELIDNVAFGAFGGGASATADAAGEAASLTKGSNEHRHGPSELSPSAAFESSHAIAGDLRDRKGQRTSRPPGTTLAEVARDRAGVARDRAAGEREGAKDHVDDPSVREFVPNRLIVRLVNTASAADVAESLVPFAAQWKSRFTHVFNGGVIELDAAHEADLLDTARRLSAHPAVLYAQPDYVHHTQVIPNDTRFSDLWNLHNTGQTGGTSDADIDAPEAWDVFTGSHNVVVASIDSGVDYTHPDLAANMWRNADELNGQSGVDDDGNGFVDDIYGYDFVGGNDSDPADDNSHGTHTVGTLGAVGNNSDDVVGVNWDVQIMALKAFNASGSGADSDIIEAIEYMTMMKTMHGVNIVVSNASWGGGSVAPAMRDAIGASIDAGIMFVAAAGNNSRNIDSIPFYPASFDFSGLISVASTTRNDALSSFSNFGATSVDLGAPGSSIRSTVPGGGTGLKSGTSMAAPHVAGAVAMLRALHPDASLHEIKTAILNSTDSLSALAGITVSGGRLNLHGAVTFDISKIGAIVTSVDPPTGENDIPNITDITLGFSEDVTPSADPADYLLLESGPNGIFEGGAGDDVVIPVTPTPGGSQLILSVDAGASPLPGGEYQLTIDADAVLDADGNPLNTTTGPGGGEDYVHHFDVVFNVEPGGDFYALSLAAGERVQIATATPFDHPSAAPRNDLDPRLVIVDPSGELLAFDNNSAPDGKNAEVVVEAPTTGTYYIQVLAESGVGEYVLTINDPPEVTHVEVNTGFVDPPDLPSGPQPTGWQQQRSDIRSIVVSFDTAIAPVTADDLVLTNTGIEAADSDQVIPLNDGQMSTDGHKVTITFEPGELPDGVYELRVMPTVTDVVGTPLDGDGNGTAGDPFVMAGDTENRFFKLTGDWNGDGGVSILDFLTLRYWFGEEVPPAPQYVDLNSDGGVSILDLLPFRANFGESVELPPPAVQQSFAASSTQQPSAAIDHDAASKDVSNAKAARDVEVVPEVDVVHEPEVVYEPEMVHDVQVVTPTDKKRTEAGKERALVAAARPKRHLNVSRPPAGPLRQPGPRSVDPAAAEVSPSNSAGQRLATEVRSRERAVVRVFAEVGKAEVTGEGGSENSSAARRKLKKLDSSLDVDVDDEVIDAIGRERAKSR